MKKLILIFLVVFGIQSLNAQNESSVRGRVFSNSEGPLIGIVVVEVDQTNRNVTSAVTDINGNFSMKIKSTANKLKFSYVGYNTQFVAIGNNKVFNIEMKDKTTLNVVEVKAKKKISSNGMDIDEKQRSFAAQTIGKEEFEGLSVASVDDAMQGKISGLDIVANSGDAGSGTQMRIRGITSINGSSEPLIVVNGIIFERTNNTQFDFATANQEQFADLLSVNVDDIESITVLKDASSTAIWGSRGANGVIQINTKRGEKGKTKVTYTYRYSGAVQPKGMTMLTGDDYTMLLKEAYFNPNQSDFISNIRELNYDKTFSEFEQFNNNTDWVKEVTQYGQTHDHYIQLSGGGEKATFLVSGGYYNQTGSVIGQDLTRYTTRMNLDYKVSDRIKFTSEFSFSYSDNKQNYTEEGHNNGLLTIAYQKMPNAAVWTQDELGNNTDRYYKMLPTLNGNLDDQRTLWNPVAVANLASKNSKSVRILPTFRISYDLLDPTATRLQYKAYVAFDVNNGGTNSFFPKELTTYSVGSSLINAAYSTDTRGLGISAENSLLFIPKFEDINHNLMFFANFKLGSSTSRFQEISSYGSPSSSITSSTAGAYVPTFGSGPGQGRSMSYSFSTHYGYKERYMFDFSLTRDGSTKFGNDKKWGTFPGVSVAWNAADEPFMKPLNSILSTLKLRPSWGITGNQPDKEYLFYSIYSPGDKYMDMPAVGPTNIELGNLRWEKVTSTNYGVDLGFFKDKFMLYFDYYHKRTDDMLFKDMPLPNTSGFTVLQYINGGSMNNDGWELNINGNDLIKVGDFKFGVSVNFSNYVNTIVTLNRKILERYNRDFTSSPMENGEYLTRVQEHNSFGSIYGFKYKGVYQYSTYEDGIANGGTSPFAFDASGNVIRDAYGLPLRMKYNYKPETNAGYNFRGGDAIYEDINHDGNINELDIVYLGNSNPLFNGGFSLKFNYKRFSATVFSNFRVGNKVVNNGRMLAENMFENNNQCASVNWRWRKDGDLTTMPRAMHKSGFNWLGSDRYVEDGSFLRVKNLQVNYSFPSKMLKPLLLSQLNLYLTVNNLFVITKYSGVDPEVGYGGLGVSKDSNQTPRSKSFTAGISVSF